MRASQDIIEYIKQFESLALDAYLCPAGAYAPTKSRAEAEKLLVTSKPYATYVMEKVLPHLSQIDGGCLVWGRKAVATGGYGRISVGRNVQLRVHRVMYILSRGAEIPEDMSVCHTCDNPSCANPEHLFIGTHKDNTADMLSKGRGVNPPVHFGESHHNATLTFDQVETIRREAPLVGNDSAVARKYGVSNQTVRRIKTYETRVAA